MRNIPISFEILLDRKQTDRNPSDNKKQQQN